MTWETVRTYSSASSASSADKRARVGDGGPDSTLVSDSVHANLEPQRASIVADYRDAVEPMNVMVSTLKLVYPPVSNQEAEWVKSDPDVEALIRSSDFYLIGARTEARFEDEVTIEDGRIRVPVSTEDGFRDEVVLYPFALAEATLVEVPETVTFHLGPKMIQFFGGTDDEAEAGTAELFEWFTTEKLIVDRGRDLPGVGGFDRFRELGTYDLLYVGIAKTTDTFDRLFDGAHHARQKILSNEWPRRPGARVTDEMILFPLRVEPFVLRTLDEDDVPTDASSGEWEAHRKVVVIDAEKAFVHLLDPKYNVERFTSYPRSKDGLYGYGYQRYGFVLVENLTFLTANHTFRGSGQPQYGLFDNYADMLTTSGETVELYVAPDRSNSQ